MTAVVTKDIDTVPGQLTDLNLQEGGALAVPEKAELVYSRMPVSVSQHELITWWSEGLINDAAFIFLALKIDRVGDQGIEDFDVTRFCEDWEGYGKGEKPKRLKESAVTGLIQKLQQKGAATVEIKMQLSLDV